MPNFGNFFQDRILKKPLYLRGKKDSLPRTENRYTCLTEESLGVLELPICLLGGGENSSPPKKKRKTRGTGQGIGRRQKSSRSISTKIKVEDRQEPEQTQLEEIAGPSSSASQIDKRSQWKNSPKGKESISKSRKKYESSEKASLTRQRYKSSQEGIDARTAYDSSPAGRERKGRYDSSQQGAERKARYELSPGGAETRRRYKSSEGGISARRRATQKYENSVIGREARLIARRRYEVRESAQQRRSRYYQTKAYKKRVKMAIKHLVTRAAENRSVGSDSGEQFSNEQPEKQPHEQLKEPEETEHPVDESVSNKEAMSIIRSHEVS